MLNSFVYSVSKADKLHFPICFLYFNQIIMLLTYGVNNPIEPTKRQYFVLFLELKRKFLMTNKKTQTLKLGRFMNPGHVPGTITTSTDSYLPTTVNYMLCLLLLKNSQSSTSTLQCTGTWIGPTLPTVKRVIVGEIQCLYERRVLFCALGSESLGFRENIYSFFDRNID